MDELKEKHKKLLHIIEKINLEGFLLSESRVKFFSQITIQVSFRDSELCFNNLISWFYVLFYEAAGRNIDFFGKKISYANAALENNVQVQKLVHAFRTYLQHNLDLVHSASDIEKRNLCESWLLENTGKSNSLTEKEWKIALRLLLDLVIDYLLEILKYLEEIKENEHKDIVIEEWEKIVKRNYSVYDYEKILIKVLTNFDLATFFDTNQLAKKNKDNWKKELDVLPDDFDFEGEAYRIIERFILKKEIIPIDGTDLIAVGAKPGKSLFTLLGKAKEMFNSNPCNKEDLIHRIKDHIS